MAFRSTSRRQATRPGADPRTALVVEGDDLIVTEFSRRGAQMRPEASRVVVRFAAKAAQIQRELVKIDEGDWLDSISSDDKATVDGTGVYADAGPDPRVNPEGAFKGPLYEHGTVNVPPHPTVGPSADQTMPDFEKALADLVKP